MPHTNRPRVKANGKSTFKHSRRSNLKDGKEIVSENISYQDFRAPLPFRPIRPLQHTQPIAINEGAAVEQLELISEPKVISSTTFSFFHSPQKTKILLNSGDAEKAKEQNSHTQILSNKLEENSTMTFVGLTMTLDKDLISSTCKNESKSSVGESVSVKKIQEIKAKKAKEVKMSEDLTSRPPSDDSFVDEDITEPFEISAVKEVAHISKSNIVLISPRGLSELPLGKKQEICKELNEAVKVSRCEELKEAIKVEGLKCEKLKDEPKMTEVLKSEETSKVLKDILPSNLNDRIKFYQEMKNGYFAESSAKDELLFAKCLEFWKDLEGENSKKVEISPPINLEPPPILLTTASEHSSMNEVTRWVFGKDGQLRIVKEISTTKLEFPESKSNQETLTDISISATVDTITLGNESYKNHKNKNFPVVRKQCKEIKKWMTGILSLRVVRIRSTKLH